MKTSVAYEPRWLRRRETRGSQRSCVAVQNFVAAIASVSESMSALPPFEFRTTITKEIEKATRPYSRMRLKLGERWVAALDRNIDLTTWAEPPIPVSLSRTADEQSMLTDVQLMVMEHELIMQLVRLIEASSTLMARTKQRWTMFLQGERR